MRDNADELFKEAIGDEEDESQITPNALYKQEVPSLNLVIHKGADDSWEKDLPSLPDIIIDTRS